MRSEYPDWCVLACPDSVSEKHLESGVAGATLRDLRASSQTADERHERGGDLVFGDDGCGARRNRFRAFRVQFVSREDQNVNVSIELPNLPHKAGCSRVRDFEIDDGDSRPLLLKQGHASRSRARDACEFQIRGLGKQKGQALEQDSVVLD